MSDAHNRRVVRPNSNEGLKVVKQPVAGLFYAFQLSSVGPRALAGCSLVLSCILATVWAGEPSTQKGNDQTALGALNFRPSPEHPFGWRGDGSGRYPAAEPPLTWGRQSLAVKELSTQARKPKAEDTGKPMPEGVIRDWLVLGPVPIPAGKAAKEDFGTDESKLAPDEGEKSGALEWKAVAVDNPWVNFWPLFNKTAGDAKAVVAYAHTWIYAAGGKPVFLHLMASNTAKLWLNGKDLGVFNANGTQIKLGLEKGWNRLLVRIAAQADTSWSKGVIQWHFNAAFFGADLNETESKNIQWSTPMPDAGPGVSSPILAGDRLFMLAERCDLVCIGANDGNVLWVRSSTFADAASEDEKKNSAAVFGEIAPLAAKVTESLQKYCAAPEKYASLREEKTNLERKINDLMRKVNPEKYYKQSDGEPGESAPTAVSDGENVYAVFGSGVAACFDLQGNRKWTTVVDVKKSEHSYAASPCLVGGKLVIPSARYLGAVALDAKTGAVAAPIVLWKTKDLDMGSTPVAVAAGNDKLIVFPYGVVARAADGKVVAQQFTPPYYNIPDYLSPAVEGRTICSWILAGEDGGRHFAFQTLPDALAEPLTMKDVKQCTYDLKGFPCWFSYDHCASPLLYQGLAYVMSVDGVLTVMDAAKGEVVYQKMMDLSPFMIHNGIVRAGCSSSPAMGGKHIYIWDNQGSAVVLEPGRVFKQLARNRLEQLWYQWGAPSRNECTTSCPIFSGNRIFHRGEGNLYCIAGEKDK